MNPTREDLNQAKSKLENLMKDATGIFQLLVNMDDGTWNEWKKVGDGRTWDSLTEFSSGCEHFRTCLRILNKMLDKP